MDSNPSHASTITYTGGIRGTNGKIQRYTSPKDAYNSTYNDVHAKLNGGSSWVKPSTTISQYTEKFAPKSDGNNPQQYAEHLTKELNEDLKDKGASPIITRNTPLAEVKKVLIKAGVDPEHALTKAHLKIEDPKVLPALNKATTKVVANPTKEEFKKSLPVNKPVTVPVIKNNKPITQEESAYKPIEVVKVANPPIPKNEVNLPKDVPHDVAQLITENKKNPKWNNYKGNYFIYSKERNEFYVLNNKHQIIDHTAGLRGRDKGDQQNTGNGSKSQWGQNNLTTPAGRYMIKDSNMSEEDKKDYNTPFSTIIDDQYGRLGVHGIYKGQFEARKEVLKNPDISKRLMSWGCINIDKSFLDKYPVLKGDSLFITKEPKI